MSSWFKKENPTKLTYSINKHLLSASWIPGELGRFHLMVNTNKQLQHRIVSTTTKKVQDIRKWIDGTLSTLVLLNPFSLGVSTA